MRAQHGDMKTARKLNLANARSSPQFTYRKSRKQVSCRPKAFCWGHERDKLRASSTSLASGEKERRKLKEQQLYEAVRPLSRNLEVETEEKEEKLLKQSSAPFFGGSSYSNGFRNWQQVNELFVKRPREFVYPMPFQSASAYQRDFLDKKLMKEIHKVAKKKFLEIREHAVDKMTHPAESDELNPALQLQKLKAKNLRKRKSNPENSDSDECDLPPSLDPLQIQKNARQE